MLLSKNETATSRDKGTQCHLHVVETMILSKRNGEQRHCLQFDTQLRYERERSMRGTKMTNKQLMQMAVSVRSTKGFRMVRKEVEQCGTNESV